MQQGKQLHVEVYAHGGWWKDSRGRTGQVPEEQASQGPVATIAMVANGFGAAGWDLANVASAQHNTYRLSFERAATSEHVDDDHDLELNRNVSISMG